MTRAVITLDAERLEWLPARRQPGGGVTQTARLYRGERVVCLLHLECPAGEDRLQPSVQVVDAPQRGAAD